ncbi:phosphoglycerate dehydrogenase-like enzyme [Salana multivorans]|uniref:Phosphoglycerate dehydrogenase-like enzyme n=1 Tax=Salana multivorans TaxID=120377 RepID=A0A3N2D8X5_9MICO|nr:NAD(P)-dependent oxidoreductase [Salana multivorans]ROR96220.1 phosphoglycerate dehydrogenase-like enzyme [Salana multivorans]
MTPPVPVHLAPTDVPEYRRAIAAGGGEVVDAPHARVLVWSIHREPEALARTLERCPRVEWVMLPSAGVDRFLAAGVLDPSLTWVSAKGVYARPVAEHALTLTLALLRSIRERARAESWGVKRGRTLFGSRVLVIGGGGIARELAALLVPFGVHLTVCRRTPDPVAFAHATIAPDRVAEHVGDADVVVVAVPLSDATRGMVDADLLARMKESSVLVNVGRGAVVVTDDLVDALAAGTIAGAGLDVTDPEPLPDGHPLWSQELALITPHTANTHEMNVPLFADRIVENLERYAAGRRPRGLVDVAAGY